MSISEREIYNLMGNKVRVSVAVKHSIDDVHTPPGLFLSSPLGENRLPVVAFFDGQKGLLYVELGDINLVDVRSSKMYEGVTELAVPDYHIRKYVPKNTE